MRVLLDENFNNDVLRGVLRRKSDADIVRAQDIPEIAGADDPTLLQWAAEQNRVLFTHDVQTITGFAYDRVREGKPMPGIFEVSLSVPIGTVIEDMLVIIECSIDGEWEGQVRYLPLR